jgi:hypothetical protein
VLDSWAVLAWLAGEASALRVERALRAAEARGLRLHLSVINAGEVEIQLCECGARCEWCQVDNPRTAHP